MQKAITIMNVFHCARKAEKQKLKKKKKAFQQNKDKRSLHNPNGKKSNIKSHLLCCITNIPHRT